MADSWRMALLPQRDGETTRPESIGARVMLVQPHALLRQSLAQSISALGVDVVADVADESDCLNALDHVAPDVVILCPDSGPHGCDGLCRRLKYKHAHLRVLVLAEDADESALISAVRSGADGYLLKSGTVHDLAAAVGAVARGKWSYDSEVCARALHRLVAEPECLTERTIEISDLSPRERQVLDLLSRGMSNKEIASVLSIGLSTTKTHVRHVLNHLRVSSRKELLPRLFHGQ